MDNGDKNDVHNHKGECMLSKTKSLHNKDVTDNKLLIASSISTSTINKLNNINDVNDTKYECTIHRNILFSHKECINDESSENSSVSSSPLIMINNNNNVHDDVCECSLNKLSKSQNSDIIHDKLLVNSVNTLLPIFKLNDGNNVNDDKYKHEINKTNLLPNTDIIYDKSSNDSSSSLSTFIMISNDVDELHNNCRNYILQENLPSSMITFNELPKDLRNLIGISGDNCMKNKMRDIRNNEWLRCRYLWKSKINHLLSSHKNKIMMIDDDQKVNYGEDIDIKKFIKTEFKNSKFIDKIDRYLTHSNSKKKKKNHITNSKANLLSIVNNTTKNINTNNCDIKCNYVDNTLFKNDNNEVFKPNNKTKICKINCQKLKLTKNITISHFPLMNNMKIDNFYIYVLNNNIETWTGTCTDGNLRPLIIKNIENDHYKDWVLEGIKTTELRSSKPNDNFLHKPVLITGGSKKGWIIVEGQVNVTGFEMVKNRSMLKLDKYKKKHKITSKKGITKYIDNRSNIPVLWHLNNAHKYRHPIFIPCQNPGRVGHYVVHSNCFNKITITPPI